MSQPKSGAIIKYCGHDASFVADIYLIEGANVIRPNRPITEETLERPAKGATHHLVDFPSSGFWRPDLGVFVVPENQVKLLPQSP